jgi:hypothetical protein
MVTMASMPVITRSNGFWPRRLWTAKRPIETVTVITAPSGSGSPKSSCRASAPPTISAMSVAIATASAWAQ